MRTHVSAVAIVATIVTALGAAIGAASALHAQEPSALERGILEQTNRARTDPAGFARDLEQLLPSFDGLVLRRPGQPVGIRTNEGAAAVREAIAFLRAQAPMPPLTWEDGLWRAASDHVRDQGPRGSTGHVGSDRSTIGQRMSRYGTWQSTAAENIDYGSDTALDVLISLIVDDGVPSRGHRGNIFSTQLRVMGAACGPHAVYRVMCVMNYAGGYVGAGQPAAPRTVPARNPDRNSLEKRSEFGNLYAVWRITHQMVLTQSFFLQSSIRRT